MGSMLLITRSDRLHLPASPIKQGSPRGRRPDGKDVWEAARICAGRDDGLTVEDDHIHGADGDEAVDGHVAGLDVEDGRLAVALAGADGGVPVNEEAVEAGAVDQDPVAVDEASTPAVLGIGGDEGWVGEGRVRLEGD